MESKRKKVLHVISSFDPALGGVSQAVATMCREFASDDWQHSVVSFDHPEADFIKTFPGQIFPLGRGSGPWNYHQGFASWLKKHLPKYDVVILHGLWLYNGFALWREVKNWAAKNFPAKKPEFFVMPHGMLDPYFQKAGSRRLKALRNSIYWHLIEKKVVRRANGLLFTCEKEKELARSTFLDYRPQSEMVIGLGVEEPPSFTDTMQEAFRSILPEGWGGCRLVLFLGRIHPKKGTLALVQAWHQFLGQSNTSARLVIAGPGLDSVYGQEVSQLVRENDLEKSVVFPGMLRGEAKWGALYGAEVSILPSHQENFGISVVESLACQTPVILSREVNIYPEIVESQAGLADGQDVDSIVRLLHQWENLSSADKQAFSQRARDCYEKYFAMPTAKQKFESFLGGETVKR